MDVTIEYCAQGNYAPRAASLSDRINARFKVKTRLIASSGGAFEVVVDGDPIWSKKATGEFPDENHLLKKLSQRSEG
mgnify:CR=1 FL=1